MTVTKRIALPVATATAALAIGGALLFYTNQSPDQKSTTSSMTTPQPSTSQISQPDTTTTTQPVAETAPTASEQATQPTTTTTTPTQPTPVSDLAKPYAASQGEDDYQSGCFWSILSYRTEWNITEAQMHDKYASIKATYPTMCAALNIAHRYPKDAPVRGM